MLALLTKYSEVSTFGGVVYFGLQNQPNWGKYFWGIVIFISLAISFYWSWVCYVDWTSSPTIITLRNVGMPTTSIPFPAVTVCFKGSEKTLIASSFEIAFQEFQKENCLTDYWNFDDSPAGDDCRDNFLLSIFPTYVKFNRDLPREKHIGELSQYVFLNPIVGYFMDAYYLRYPKGTKISNLLSKLDNINQNLRSIPDLVKKYKDLNITQDDPEIVIKVLWKSNPPCSELEDESYFKQCTWQGVNISCSAIFRRTFTDQGICCSTNDGSIEDIYKNSKYIDIMKRLQKADQQYNVDHNITYKSLGSTQAGIHKGLKLILDARANFLQPSTVGEDFNSITVMISTQNNFPIMNQKGISIQPGFQSLVAIRATKISSDDGLRSTDPVGRNCKFENEIGDMELFKNYSQLNCQFECAMKITWELNQKKNDTACSPWDFPKISNASLICGPIRARVFRSIFNKLDVGQLCPHCLSDCERIIYKSKVTNEPFRTCSYHNFLVSPLCQPESSIERFSPQLWADPVITELSKNYTKKIPQYASNVFSSLRSGRSLWDIKMHTYDAYKKDLAVVHIFYDMPSLFDYYVQPSQRWIIYFANVGGILGLFVGLTLMTLFELVWLYIGSLHVLVDLSQFSEEKEPLVEQKKREYFENF